MTSSRLRELSRLASPAPWGGSSPYGVRSGDDTYGVATCYAVADRNLIVALRNDAEKYADLRDAGKALLAALCTGSEPHDWSDIDAKANAFRAALAALGGEE